MALSNDDMKEMSITFGGRATISGLQAEEGVDGSTNLLTSSEGDFIAVLLFFIRYVYVTV